MNNFEPLITVNFFKCDAFQYSAQIIVSGLLPLTEHSSWFFFADGTSPGNRGFVSDSNGRSEFTIGGSGNEPLIKGLCKIGISEGHPSLNKYDFENWYKSPNRKTFVTIKMDYPKTTRLYLDHTDEKIPWGKKIKVSGRLWFTDVSWIWPNGDEILRGRKIYLKDTKGSVIASAYTDALSKFTAQIDVDSVPKDFFIQAHYEGDEKYFDKCESNIIRFSIGKHKTFLKLEVNDLKLGFKTTSVSNPLNLETGQLFRFSGILSDLDNETNLENKNIIINSDMPFKFHSLETSIDGSFELNNLESPDKPQMCYIDSRFTGDNLYEEAYSRLSICIEDKKERSRPNIKQVETYVSVKNDSTYLEINPKLFHRRTFKINNDLCFVLIPFSDQFFRIYEDHLCPTLQKRFKKVMTAKDIFESTSIVEDIWIYINEARLVVADVTGKNPNVFYELGITHTLGKDFIILTQNKNDVPFDINHIRYIEYSDDKKGWDVLEQKLSLFVEKIYDR